MAKMKPARWAGYVRASQQVCIYARTLRYFWYINMCVYIHIIWIGFQCKWYVSLTEPSLHSHMCIWTWDNLFYYLSIYQNVAYRSLIFVFIFIVSTCRGSVSCGKRSLHKGIIHIHHINSGVYRESHFTMWATPGPIEVHCDDQDITDMAVCCCWQGGNMCPFINAYLIT